jgi:soluble lytic murein transglycosylase-like protein
MAGTTVIDKLIVELGLDPKKFTEGQKKAAAGLKELRQDAKETGDDVSESADKGGNALMALGKRVLTVAAIFKVLTYTTKNILEASRATYSLANASRTLGESARDLRNFENVAEMMGGTAEGARKSIQGLKQALFDVKFNGQWSQQLTQISRLGVKVVGAGGKPRDFKDVYLDTAGALQNNMSSGKMTESEALMFAEQAGFDPGLARALVGGRDAAGLALARQESRRQVSGADVAAATANEQSITSAGQAKETAFTAAQTGSSGFITGTAGGLEKAWAGGATGELGATWEGVRAALEPVTTGLGDVADAAVSAADSLMGLAHRQAGRGRAGYEATIQAAARKHGVSPEILAGVLNTESRFDPNASNKSGARGIAQLMPQYFPGAGIDPMKDIDTAAAYLAQLHGSFVKTGSNEADAWDKALMSFNGGERRVRTSNVFGDGSSGRDLTSETINYPGQVLGYATARGGTDAGATTNVDIGEVNVVTSATDANGIAGSIADATRRKFTAAQAPSQGPQ